MESNRFTDEPCTGLVQAVKPETTLFQYPSMRLAGGDQIGNCCAPRMWASSDVVREGPNVARAAHLCRNLRYRRTRARQGVSGERAYRAREHRHRLDALQPDAGLLRSDLRYSL